MLRTKNNENKNKNNFLFSFSFSKQGQIEPRAGPPEAEQIDFFVDEAWSDDYDDHDDDTDESESDDDDNNNNNNFYEGMALLEIDGDGGDIAHHKNKSSNSNSNNNNNKSSKNSIHRRAQRQKSFVRILRGILTVVVAALGIAALLDWKARSRSRYDARYISCAGYNSISSGTSTSTSSTTMTMTMDEWLDQDMDNITALCDPTFPKTHSSHNNYNSHNNNKNYNDPTSRASPSHLPAIAKAATTPTKVFVLMGEANMVGAGRIHGDSEGSLEYTVAEKGRFSHLLTAEKEEEDDDPRKRKRKWTKSPNVRLVEVREDFHVYTNDWLGVNDANDYFGIEQQFGYVMGSLLNSNDNDDDDTSSKTSNAQPQSQSQSPSPVLIAKCAHGQSSLGGEFLPPHSLMYETGGYVYPGHGQSPGRWKVGEGDHPLDVLEDKDKGDPDWHAGIRYDECVGNVRRILWNIGDYYPGATDYEIAGFVWWQGDSDRRSGAYTERYEGNLDRLVRGLKHDLAAPQAKFVVASLGQGGYGDSYSTTGNNKNGNSNSNTARVFRAQMNLASAMRHPHHAGSVAAVDIRAAWRGPFGDSGSDNIDNDFNDEDFDDDFDGAHYGNHAETFLEVGNAVGLAMAKLLFE